MEVERDVEDGRHSDKRSGEGEGMGEWRVQHWTESVGTTAREAGRGKRMGWVNNICDTSDSYFLIIALRNVSIPSIFILIYHCLIIIGEQPVLFTSKLSMTPKENYKQHAFYLILLNC